MPRFRLQPSCAAYLRAAVSAAIVFGLNAPAAAQNSVAPMLRVRANSAGIAALIERGIAQSATFKGLVDTIGGTDGIVYVEEGKCGHGVRACLILTVTVAGPHRILRVMVNRRRPEQEIAAIGHELWHAIEVLRETNVRDYRAIFMFYERIAPTALERFETAAAIRVGLTVDAELHRHR